MNMISDNVADYDFDLPESCIAQEPSPERAASRLMFLNGAEPPRHHVFSDLPLLLQPGDVLVRNVTRVIPARLIGRRAGGGKSELLLVRCVEEDTWLCMARPAAPLKPGKEVTFGDGAFVATVLRNEGGGYVTARFSTTDGTDFWSMLQQHGRMPLPPYIARDGQEPTEADAVRYQTVYAREAGAVAAPTAGLHFTEAVFHALAQRGVEVADLVLHVGPGTFRPIQTERISEHVMDTEHYDIPEETARLVMQARAEGRRVIAVGTTTTRALESAVTDDGGLRAGHGATSIFIHPPYAYRVIDGLITNFHLPRSTLLMLVSALIGRERLFAAYQDAISQGYRFYSYGDAMLLLP